MASSDLICLGNAPPQVEEDKYLLIWYYAGMPETEQFWALDAEAAKAYQEEFNQKYNLDTTLYVKVRE